MLERNLKQFATLSPFELKDKLIAIASSDAQRLMLNAGRGNPNFLATLPRWAFLSLGEFALRESERSYSYLDSGFGGLPEHDGIVQRFDAYAALHRQTDGAGFLRSAISYVRDQLGLDQDAFLFEMVSAFLGSTYPTPPRMLCHTEQIVKAYLTQEMFGPLPPNGPFSIFATEGGTAAMTYIFETLRANGLIKPGDKIAIATPIFSPYLEIPVLDDYQLEVVDIRMDRLDDWQLPQSEIDKLLDPAIKIFCLVNPSNPPSSKLSDGILDRLAALVAKRHDLFIVTDDEQVVALGHQRGQPVQNPVREFRRRRITRVDKTEYLDRRIEELVDLGLRQLPVIKPVHPDIDDLQLVIVENWNF